MYNYSRQKLLENSQLYKVELNCFLVSMKSEDRLPIAVWRLHQHHRFLSSYGPLWLLQILPSCWPSIQQERGSEWKKKIEKKGHTFHLWPFPGVPTEHLCQKSSYLATLNLEWKLGTPFAFPVAVYPAKN